MATFGKTSIGALWYGNGYNRLIGSKYPLTEPADISKLTLYVREFFSGSQGIMAAIYDLNFNLIAVTERKILLGNPISKWIDFNIVDANGNPTTVHLEPADYFLCFLSEGNISVASDTSLDATSFFDSSATTYALGFPQTITGWKDTAAKNISIYASYQGILPPSSGNMTIVGDGANYVGYKDMMPIIGASGTVLRSVVNAIQAIMATGDTLFFEGIFSIENLSIQITKSITLDFRQGQTDPNLQAKMTLKTNNYTWEIFAPNVKKLGGYWTSDVIASLVMGIRFVENCANGSVDGATIYGLGSPIESPSAYALWASYGSNSETFQNCNVTGIHGLSCSGVLLNAGNDHKIIDCKFTEIRTGIHVDKISGRNFITGCEFSKWHQGANGHAIYLDGGSGSVGHNEISFNNFHDPYGFCAIQIKCQNNKIHDNTFINFPVGALPLHIYSQYSATQANDNDIYNNKIIDCAYIAVMMGNSDCASPTLRNKFHDNEFIRCADVFWLNSGDPSSQTVEDTRIYYNKFTDCGRVFPKSPSPLSSIKRTIIAYNTFNPPLDAASVAALKSYENTMIAGNIGLEDFNASAVYDPTSPYYIAPPTGGTVQHTINIPLAANGTTIPTGLQRVIEGDSISILATADTGFQLKNWLVDGVEIGSYNPLTVTADTNHTVQAIFEAIPQTVYTCPTCGATFNTQAELDTHLLTHNQPPTQEAGLGATAILALIVLIIGVIAATMTGGTK